MQKAHLKNPSEQVSWKYHTLCIACPQSTKEFGYIQVEKLLIVENTSLRKHMKQDKVYNGPQDILFNEN